MKVKIKKTIEIEMYGETYIVSEDQARQLMLELSEALESLRTN